MSLWELKCEHERLQNEVSQLSQLLENITSEKDQAMLMYKESYVKEARLKNDNNLLEKESKALSYQIQTLLSEIEILQGKKKSGFDFNDKKTYNCEPVIFDQLTPFRDIQELQNQNQNLLSLIHELTSRFENEESFLKDKINTLEFSLKNDTQKLIEDLKSCIEQQDAKNKRLKAEQAILRKLAKVDNDTDVFKLNEQYSSGVTDDQTTNPYTRKLEEILESTRKEAANSYEILQDKYDEIFSSHEALKIQSSQTESQLDYLNERISSEVAEKRSILSSKQELLQHYESAKNDASQKELLLKEHQLREIRLQGELQDSNDSLSSSKKELETFKIEYSQLENQLSVLQSQVSCCEQKISISNEKESAYQEIISSLQSQIAENLETLRTERNEFESKLEQAQERLLSQSMIYDKRSQEYVCCINDLSEQVSKLQSTINELEKVNKEVNKENKKLACKNDQLLEMLRSNFPDYDSRVSDLCDQLLETQTQLQESRDNVAQFQAISQAAEDALSSVVKEMSEHESKFKQEMQTLNDRLKLQQNMIDSLNSRNLESEIDLRLKAKQNEHDQELVTLKNEINRLNALYTEALESIEQFKREAANTNKRLDEVPTTEQSDNNSQELESLHQDLNETKGKLDDLTMSHESEIISIQKEKDLLLSKIETLEKKNIELKELFDGLLENIDKPDAQLKDNANQNFTPEMLKFFRQEKELSDSRLQISLINQARLKAEIESTNNLLSQTRKALEEERQKGSQVEQLNELKRLLKSEEEKVSELEKSNTILQEEIVTHSSKFEDHLADNISVKKILQETQDQLSELQADSEFKFKEVKMLEEDNQRYQTLIHKLQSKNPQFTNNEHLSEENDKLQKEILALKQNLEKIQTDSKEKTVQAEEKLAAAEAKKTHYYKVATRFKNLWEKSKENVDKSSTDEVLQTQINELTRVSNSQENILQKLRKILELPEGDEGFVDHINKLKLAAQEAEKTLNSQKENYVQLQATLRRNQKALDLTKAKLKNQEIQSNHDAISDLQTRHVSSSETKLPISSNPILKTNSSSFQLAAPLPETGRSRSAPPEEESEAHDHPTKKQKSPGPV